jgi:hypothetical protein
MRKKFLGLTLLSALILLLGLVAPAKAELNLDFTLVNKTGYPIKELYIGPTSSDDWGDNLLKRSLKDEQSFDLTFSPKATAKKWDIKVVYEDGDKAQWLGYKLEEISKITLFWDNEKQKSTAKTE